MHFLSDEKKERIYIARFRAELAFWGHDTSNMTDEEIKEGINKFSEMVSVCGMTSDEVADSLKALANIN
jgi:transaldolase